MEPSTKGASPWWLLVILSIFMLIAGQAVATLLGRIYYDQGGKSIWMATLVQSAGFPFLLLPIMIWHYSTRTSTVNPTPSPNSGNSSPASASTIAFIYVFLGTLMAGDNVLYSYGLLYLPVSTYSLICATQLAFNAVFSYLLNSQKFTPLIFNSVILLSLSASLLACRSDSEGTTTSGVSGAKGLVGVLFTLGASAGYALWLSLIQLSFQRVLKETFSSVLKLLFYTSAVATSICIVGLFASGQWRTLGGEMKGYGKGGVSYVMTLAWTAVSWQVSSIGTVCLICWVSSLFSNVISTLALPIVPVFAVIFFHDKMDGVKIIALLIAMWGFLSYIYQHYIDDPKRRTARNEEIRSSGGCGLETC